MPDASKMPARIWAGEGKSSFRFWQKRKPREFDNSVCHTQFIRADIAEQRERVLVEALRFYADPKNWTGGTILDMEASHFDGWSKAQAALTAWEASNG